MDGPALCREVRKLPRENYTYIVLLTSLEGKSNYLEAMEAGADDFMTKPFDHDQLTARVHVAERIIALQWRVAEGARELREKNEQMKRAEAALEIAQRERLEISRQAGMAEVAIGVLHNVGNVLNSVNISLGVAMEKAGQMEAASLSRIAALLQAHAENLPAFFANHPQGMRLPQFLGQLAEHFGENQQTLLGELESLLTNIEHINEIVAMQQSYATGGGVIEVLSLANLVEDALRMNSASFDRHGIRFVCEFDSKLPPMAVDRDKVLLILINLIRNAKYACDERSPDDKCITARTHLNGDGLAMISVSETTASASHRRISHASSNTASLPGRVVTASACTAARWLRPQREACSAYAAMASGTARPSPSSCPFHLQSHEYSRK